MTPLIFTIKYSKVKVQVSEWIFLRNYMHWRRKPLNHEESKPGALPPAVLEKKENIIFIMTNLFLLIANICKVRKILYNLHCIWAETKNQKLSQRALVNRIKTFSKTHWVFFFLPSWSYNIVNKKGTFKVFILNYQWIIAFEII